VSPKNGEIVYGGEHHWGTGREPWRCPILNVKHPDGTLRYQLLDWGGPFVGLDNLRLVSDTAVRRVSHDSEGNIIAVLWSDGGNSVGGRQPTDIRRGTGSRGVGLTTAGAGATSFAWLMRIEPKHYQVIGWTLWCSQYGHKANGASIERTGEAEDGSTCFAGGSAWGLRQTPNRLADTEPGGDYIAVLTPDLTGVRFSSIVPGAGMARVSRKCSWGVFTGAPGGKGRAVFLCGAGETGDNYGLVTPTPTVKAMQGKHGGGISDGWFVVLDLSKPTPEAEIPPVPKRRMGYRNAAHRVGKKKRRSVDAEDGTVYEFNPDFPKWVTCDAEFRHPDPVNYWPNFFYGRPVKGKVTWDAKKPTGSFEILCDRLVQPKGEHDQRVLGELIKTGQTPPSVTFSVSNLGPIKTETFQKVDRKGRKRDYTVSYCEADAVLDIDGRQVKLKPKITLDPAAVVEKKIPCIRISAWFTLKGSDLGMTGRAKNEEIDVRISTQGMIQGAAEKYGKKRKRRRR
jgi:hypothetical protein